MVGQFGDRRIGVVSRTAQERVGNIAVERASLAREQVRVDRLARQRVAELEALFRQFDYQLRRDRLLQRLDQRLVVQS